jgi:hypothetical protein
VLSLLAAAIKSRPTMGGEMLGLFLNLFRALSIILTTSLRFPEFVLLFFELLLFDINN